MNNIPNCLHAEQFNEKKPKIALYILYIVLYVITIFALLFLAQRAYHTWRSFVKCKTTSKKLIFFVIIVWWKCKNLRKVRISLCNEFPSRIFSAVQCHMKPFWRQKINKIFFLCLNPNTFSEIFTLMLHMWKWKETTSAAVRCTVCALCFVLMLLYN